MLSNEEFVPIHAQEIESQTAVDQLRLSFSVHSMTVSYTHLTLPTMS